MDSAYFSSRSGGYLIFFRKFFFGFQNLDPFYRPVAGKPLVLEVLCLEVALLWHLPELLKPFLKV